MGRASPPTVLAQPNAFSAFALLLADRITRVAHRATVDRGGPVGRVLRDMRRNVEVAQIAGELAPIVSLVGAEREPARSRRIAHGHRLGRLAFDGSCCPPKLVL